MPAAPAKILPTTKRPVPLRARSDLVAQRIERRGEAGWMLKDPVGLKYHEFLPEQYAILHALDGRRSLEEIQQKIRRDFPVTAYSLADVQRIVADLHEKGLLLSNRTGQGEVLIERERKQRRTLLQILQSLLYLRLPGWDPEPALQWMYPLVRWMFRPWAVTAAMLLVVSAWVLLAVQFDHFRRALPEFQQFFGWPNLLLLWLTAAIAKVIHEFGHGLSCRHYGGECHEMGIVFLVFTPCLYCDASDSWMLPNKWQRIAIAAAGMYVEVFLSAIAIFVWWNTAPGLIHHLCLNVFFVTTLSTVIFNANPLMRFDGYFMLSDWLEIPNLRPKSDQMLREKFAWHCLGIESPPDPFLPQSGRGWFVAFAVAAALYRWVVLFGILLFLYTWLKPHGLQSIGIALAALSLAGIVISMGTHVYRIVTAPRAAPMSRRKPAFSLAVLAIAAAAASMIPFPLHVEAQFLVEPLAAENVFAVTPGRLVEIAVEPGERVSAGTLLARLENVDKEDARRELLVQRDVRTSQISALHALDDAAQEALARERLASVELQIAELDRQLKHLTITAPIGGHVVEPPFRESPAEADKGEPLPTWRGTPLERRNLGAYLEPRTHLLSIAPAAEYRAVILIDQADRNEVHVGQQVELKFSHLPDRTWVAQVTDLSQRHLEFAPGALSNKSGGELPTVTDPRGREKLVSSVYQASVVLDQETELIQSGMQGRARLLAGRRSAAAWLWRSLRGLFHFRL